MRGSVYLAVLGAAMLVALIGVAGVMVNRVQYRTAAANREAAAAGVLARSAVELAMHRIAEGGWRAAYPHDTWAAEQILGGGKITFKLLADGGNLADADTVRIVGRGRAGDAMRMCSVRVRIHGSAMHIVTGSWRREVEEQ